MAREIAGKRYTSGQRKALAAKVNANLKREAEKWMRERQMSFDEAFLAVLQDPEVSAICYEVGPLENFVKQGGAGET